MPMIATGDIGAAAATELLELDFQGHQVRELQGQRDLTMRAATAIIGEAIGRPDLAYVQDGEDHFCADLRAVGCSESIIGLMTHIAILEQLDGNSAQWLEHVTETEYSAERDKR